MWPRTLSKISKKLFLSKWLPLMRFKTNFILLNLFLWVIFLIGCTTFFQRDYYNIQKNVVFKKGQDFSLAGDLYLPKEKSLRPAVVVVHGGSWARRTGDMESICRDLASAGYVVLNTTYRFVPENKFPAALEDVRDAVQWIKNNASTYNVDPDRIGLWGYSAGAHLALLAAVDGNLGVRGIVAGGTPANLTAWPNSPLVKALLGVTYAENPKLWKQASPVFHVTEKSPPVFLYHGDWDSLVEVEQMDMMAQALQNKQRDVQTYRVTWLGHMTVYLLSQTSINKGIEFLKQKVPVLSQEGT